MKDHMEDAMGLSNGRAEGKTQRIWENTFFWGTNQTVTVTA